MEIFKDERVAKLIKLIKEQIHGSHFENKVFVVGGTIRDSLLGIKTRDIDICVLMPNGGQLFSSYMTSRNGCHIYGKNPVLYKNSKTYKFNLHIEEFESFDIECSTATKSLVDDALERDLTINSLYYDISNDKLLDPTEHGIGDLMYKTLRCPSTLNGNCNRIYMKDPIKMVRTIRFSTLLEWGIEKDTWLSIIEHTNLINQIAKEKIAIELCRILLADKPSIGIRKMYYCGMLHSILPDVYDMTTMMAKKETLFDHTMNVLDCVDRRLVNRLSALFHEITSLLASNDKRYKESKAFAIEVVGLSLLELGFSKTTIANVENAITYHDAFSRCSEKTIPSDKSLRKFINLVGNNISVVLDLMYANNLCTYPSKAKQVIKIGKRIAEIIKTYEPNSLPITGKDIMKEFNLKEGPHIGILLDNLRKELVKNPNLTKEQAFSITEKKLKKITV